MSATRKYSHPTIQMHGCQDAEWVTLTHRLTLSPLSPTQQLLKDPSLLLSYFVIYVKSSDLASVHLMKRLCNFSDFFFISMLSTSFRGSNWDLRRRLLSGPCIGFHCSIMFDYTAATIQYRLHALFLVHRSVLIL